jgi:uncharacterized protein YcsI (UPF0317 family)
MTTSAPEQTRPDRIDAREAAAVDADRGAPALSRRTRRTHYWMGGGFTQANMVILPQDWAFDMLLFGQRNPQRSPLLDVTDPGAPTSRLAPDARPALRSAPLPRLARRRARGRADGREQHLGATTW